MKRPSMLIFLLLAILFTAGCEALNLVNVPAYAKLKDADKTLLQGSLTDGALTLANVNGLQCSGVHEFSYFEYEPTTEVPLNCSDGRTGKVLLTINETATFKFDPKKTKKVTGYGQGILSDGTKLEVFIGRVSGTMKAPSFIK